MSKPNPVDVHVGQQVKLRRTSLRLSQEKLGDALGVTFQQIQKYERGTNRIGSSRLHKLGQVLRVPVSFFFQGIDGSKESSSALKNVASLGSEALPLLNAYYSIPDDQTRKQIFNLIKSLGNSEAY